MNRGIPTTQETHPPTWGWGTLQTGITLMKRQPRIHRAHPTGMLWFASALRLQPLALQSLPLVLLLLLLLLFLLLVLTVSMGRRRMLRDALIEAVAVIPKRTETITADRRGNAFNS